MKIKKRIVNLVFAIFLIAFFSFVSADVISINSGGGDNVIVNPSEELEGFFFDTTRTPIDPSPYLVSVDGSNESDSDLNCSSLIEDPDGDNMTVVLNWYVDDSLSSTNNYSSDNATILAVLLDNSNLDLGEVWICSMQVYDEFKSSNAVNSSPLTIIDATLPIVNILTPNSSYTYTNLDIDFNLTVIENENISFCFQSIDGGTNTTMTRINDTYFSNQSRMATSGTHNVTFYCNDTSNNWGTNFTNFTISDEASIAIYLSPTLAWNVNWTILSLPANDLDANGNNGPNATDYYVNISAEGTNVDLYVRADGDLLTAALDAIGLGNETFVVNTTNSSVPDYDRITMNTSYTLIGENLANATTVYMKFYLDAPSSQAAGEYLNNLDFKAVRYGYLP